MTTTIAARRPEPAPGPGRSGGRGEKAGDSVKARLYYERLVALTSTADAERSEVKKARQFLSKS